MDYQYMEYILENNMRAISSHDDEEIKVTYLIMNFVKFRLADGSNIFHILPTNERFLQFYSKVVNMLVEDYNFPSAESFYFSVIYPDKNGLTPLEIAIQKRASRPVEIMLDMLSCRPDYNFSKYLQKHFYTLLEMKSLSFEKFLSGCTFSIAMNFKHEWKFSKDTRQFAYHSSYLDEDFLNENFQATEAKKKE